MIIVLTENGTAFVNEKEFRSVWHIKEDKQLIAYYKTDASIGNDGDKIEKVISVHYYSDSQEVNFHDEGNELKNLNEAYSTLLKQFDKLRRNYLDLGNEKINLAYLVDDLKKKLAEYEAK